MVCDARIFDIGSTTKSGTTHTPLQLRTGMNSRPPGISCSNLAIQSDIFATILTATAKTSNHRTVPSDKITLTCGSNAMHPNNPAMDGPTDTISAGDDHIALHHDAREPKICTVSLNDITLYCKRITLRIDGLTEKFNDVTMQCSSLHNGMEK